MWDCWRHARRIGVVGLIGCCLSAGCAKPPPPPPEPVPFGGAISRADNKPLPVVVLRLYPEGGATQSYRPTTIIKDGKFADKCLPGSYKFFLVIPQDGGNAADVIKGGPGKGSTIEPILAPYFNPNQTPWKVTIPPEGKTDIVLEIKEIKS